MSNNKRVTNGARMDNGELKALLIRQIEAGELLVKNHGYIADCLNAMALSFAKLTNEYTLQNARMNKKVAKNGH